MSIAQNYSGVVLNQNTIPEDPADLLTFGTTLYPSPTLDPSSALYPSGSGYIQTFQLPADYARESVNSSGDAVIANIPSLSGFQLFLAVSAADTANIAWEVDYYDGAEWNGLGSGTSTGTAQTGNTWFTVLFDDPITVDPTWLAATFRIIVSSTGGVAGVYYSVPNPLSSGQAYDQDGNPLTDAGRDLSIMFRVLATVVDSGTDFLGNVYRSALITQAADNVDTIESTSTGYWLSQPSPSQFAVESLYFDVRDGEDPVVIDHLTLDPLTPNVWFRVYYSNDSSGPGTDVPSWENLLWYPVYQPFQATRKQTFAFPEPISARYVQVEFTNLQAKSYNPGPFQLPSTYKKHPKWVLDYFLALFATQDLDLLSSGTNVVYDALDLAFTYYQGDIVQAPAAPALSQPTPAQVQFFQQENMADQVDATTLAQINVAFQPFTSQPALLGDLSTILGSYAASAATANYSTETISTAIGNTTSVSNLQREPLLIEKGFPVMFFYIPCRHAYRIAQAMFEKDVGYFAGVQSLTFHRDVYTNRSDQTQYNEELADGANVLINDWVTPL